MTNATNLTESVNATILYPAVLTISYSERVGVSVVFLLTSILAISGNMMVIVAVIRSKNLQTTINAFLVCQSTANLVTGLVLPWNVVGLLGREGWPLESQAPCYATALFLITSLGASLYSLAGIAFNRMLYIRATPKVYQRCFSPVNVAIMITVIWLLPFFTVLIPPLFGIGQLGYDEIYHVCSEVDQHQQVQHQRAALAAIFYPIPMTTLIMSYGIIFKTIRRNFRHQFKETTNQPSDFDWGAGHESRKSRLKHQQHSITVNLFINVCAFFLLNLPFGIALVLPNNSRVSFFTGVVFLMHSFVHPVLYGIKHPQFHQAFCQMLHLKNDPQHSSGSAHAHPHNNKCQQTPNLRKDAAGMESSLGIELK